MKKTEILGAIRVMEHTGIIDKALAYDLIIKTIDSQLEGASISFADKPKIEVSSMIPKVKVKHDTKGKVKSYTQGRGRPKKELPPEVLKKILDLHDEGKTALRIKAYVFERYDYLISGSRVWGIIKDHKLKMLNDPKDPDIKKIEEMSEIGQSLHKEEIREAHTEN